MRGINSNFRGSGRREHGVIQARYALMVSQNAIEDKLRSAGLCSNCRFMRPMKSDRGSVFYKCELSATDPSFPKYPRLPVLECRGYDPIAKSPELDELS